jgi:hypothetical protein
MRFRDSTQELAGLGMKRIKEDLFDMTLDILVSIHAPAPLCGTDMDPVCGAITSARVALRINQGLQQQRFDAIGVQPILGDLMNHEREDLAGKLVDLNPGKDQEPAVVHDPWQVALPSLITPADPVFTGSHFQGSTGEKQTGENPV